MLGPCFTLLSSLALLSGIASAVNHTVVVGGPAGLVFTPDTVTAAIGDLIIFDFKAKAHTVTQSSFAQPCTLLKNGSISGFDSGLVSNPDGTLQRSMVIEVSQTAPIWVYCAPHCALGMVMGVNVPTTGERTLATYKAASMAGGGANGTTSTNSTTPGGASTGAAPIATLTGASRGGASSAAAGASGTAGAGLAGASSSAIPGGAQAGSASSLVSSLSSILLVIPVAFAVTLL